MHLSWQCIRLLQSSNLFLLLCVIICNQCVIHQLRTNSPDVQQAWFADDATSAASCSKLKTWWDDLIELGPTFGYYPNGPKTHLIVKPEHEEIARQLYSLTLMWMSPSGEMPSWCSSRIQDIHRGICDQQGAGLGTGNHTFSRSSHHPTPCSLRGLHPWPLKPLVLHLQNNPWHPWSVTPTGDCYPPTPDPGAHWPSTLLQTRTRPPCSPSQAWRLRPNQSSNKLLLCLPSLWAPDSTSCSFDSSTEPWTGHWPVGGYDHQERHPKDKSTETGGPSQRNLQPSQSSAEMFYRPCQRERLLLMDLSPPTGRSRFLPPQRRIQRCPMPEIRVESQ